MDAHPTDLLAALEHVCVHMRCSFDRNVKPFPGINKGVSLFMVHHNTSEINQYLGTAVGYVFAYHTKHPKNINSFSVLDNRATFLAKGEEPSRTYQRPSVTS